MIAGETTMKTLRTLTIAAAIAVTVFGVAPAVAQVDLQRATDWQKIDQTRSDLVEITRFAEEFSGDAQSQQELILLLADCEIPLHAVE